MMILQLDERHKTGAEPSSDSNAKFPKSMASSSAACQRVSVSRHADRRPPRRVTAKQTMTTAATDKERLDCREAFDTSKEKKTAERPLGGGGGGRGGGEKNSSVAFAGMMSLLHMWGKLQGAQRCIVADTDRTRPVFFFRKSLLKISTDTVCNGRSLCP